MKIAFIGAGSIVFGMNLLTEIQTFPSLRKYTIITLGDVDPGRLDLIYRLILMHKKNILTC